MGAARRLDGSGRCTSNSPWQKAPLHSTGDASRLTALFLGRIWPICSLVTPCQPGASPVSVRRGVSPRAARITPRDRAARAGERTNTLASRLTRRPDPDHEDLLEQDEQVSRKRVIRLMQEGGLKARTRKRFTLTMMSDHDQPVAANLLDRQLEGAAPNQRWVGDTTEFVIGSSGKLYLAVVLDLFSRFVVGWAVSAVNDRHLTIKALEMALKRRCPEIGLLHHSNQGCTYRHFKGGSPMRSTPQPRSRSVAVGSQTRVRGPDQLLERNCPLGI